MEQIMLAAAPFVVTIIVALSKMVLSIPSSVSRVAVLRVLVAILSYSAALGSAWLSGGPVDMASIGTLSTTLVTALGSTGVYFFTSKK